MCSGIRRRISDSPVATFFVVAYLLSWTAWSPLVFRDWWATWSPLVVADDAQTLVFIVIGGFGPLVAAGLVTWIVGDSVREWAGQLLRWKVQPRYWAFALLFPGVAIVTASAIHIFVFGGEFDPDSTSTLVLYPVLFVQVFLIGALWAFVVLVALLYGPQTLAGENNIPHPTLKSNSEAVPDGGVHS